MMVDVMAYITQPLLQAFRGGEREGEGGREEGGGQGRLCVLCVGTVP
jgi:hypothetical protein